MKRIIKNLFIVMAFMCVAFGIVHADGPRAAGGAGIRSLEILHDGFPTGLPLELPRGTGPGMEYAYNKNGMSGAAVNLYYLIHVLDRTDLTLFGGARRLDGLGQQSTGLNDKYFGANVSYEPLHGVVFSGDFRKGSLGDGATYHAEGLETKITVTDAPSLLYVQARAERQIFSGTSPLSAASDRTTYSSRAGFKQDIIQEKDHAFVQGASVEVALAGAGDTLTAQKYRPEAHLNVDINSSVSAGVTYLPTGDNPRFSFSLSFHR